MATNDRDGSDGDAVTDVMDEVDLDGPMMIAMVVMVVILLMIIYMLVMVKRR